MWLAMWTNDHDYVIAESAVEALALYTKFTGDDNEETLDDWERYDEIRPFTFYPECYAEDKITAPVWAFLGAYGKGYFAGTEC